MSEVSANFLKIVESELAGVEASLRQVDGLIKRAQLAGDTEALERFRAMHARLMEARHRLESEFKDLEADLASFDETRRGKLAESWRALKQAVDELMENYGS